MSDFLYIITHDDIFKPIFIISVILFGLCVGSFLNVVIFRYETKESISKQSHCRICNNKLKWYDNIPLISYLLLHGKCRYCGNKISKQYPIVEFLNSTLWLLIFLKFGISINSLIYMLMASGLIALSVIDEKKFIIPNQIILYLCIIGIINLICNIILEYDWKSLIIGGISCGLFMLLVFLATSGKGLGFGDVKLMFAIGLITGWKNAAIGFIIGCICAIIIHYIRMKIKNASHKLAFGPYLALGAYIGTFIGNDIIDVYFDLLMRL